MPRRTTIPALVTGLGVGLLALAPAGAASAATIDPVVFADTVTVDGVREHLNQFQAIADANGGNRAAGTPGYEASGAYVESVLQAAGYATERQYFETTTQTVASESLLIDGTALTPAGEILEFSPSTTPTTGITAALIAPADPLGCDAAAWSGVNATGLIAVVSRGQCTFAEKNLAAQAAGAAGVIIYNNTAGPLSGTLGGADPAYIPGFGIEQAQGQSILAALATDPTLTATLAIDQTTDDIETFNVIAETPTGTADNVVMLGAHLDSVPEGPGINDNGSGSAAILETAVQLAQSGTLNNKVRFAWWGAEEIGLVGSTYYVDDLLVNDPAALDRIATYLNFDMVGSPNYVISVYDADESTFVAPVEVPAGSIETEDVFTDYFDSIGQPYIDSAFDGRSDYDAFIANGVAASGLFTGADDIKTQAEFDLFGGVVGEQHDQNYHLVGDDIDNINDEALGIMIRAIAFATASLANDTFAVNGFVNPVPAAPVPPVVPAAVPTLPATGPDTAPIFATGAGLLLLGLAGLVVTRRRQQAAPVEVGRSDSE
ncbi:MAG: M20/M25/M40 family metallo-hydrolase [Naasia sp.]